MSNIIEQVEVHVMAQFFYSRSGATGIVVITNKPELLIGQFPEQTRLFVVCNPWRVVSCRNQLAASLPNANFITPRRLNQKFLEDKILLCIDFLEDGGLLTGFRKQQLKRIAARALISIVNVQSSPTGQASKLRSLLPANQTLLVGKARRLPNSTDKDQLLTLGGRLLDIGRQAFPLLSVLAIMHVYNEQDIITATIKHLLEQGVDVHVIDNWSIDDTYEIIQSLASTSTRVTYERFPNKANNKFELGKMLTRVTDVAKAKSQYKWVMLNDADEIRWSPWQGVNLQQAFSFIDSLGYSAVDYTVFNFIPTKEGFNAKQDLLKFFNYGEFSGIEGHFVQVKSWKNHPAADMASSGGHHVAFPNQKIFPLKFFLGHYPIRSSQHGREKIFKQRKARFSEAEKQKGWHVQYDNMSEGTSFIGDKEKLIDFSAKGFWEEFILERLCGIGVKRD